MASFDLVSHLERQIAFSRKTFGPHERRMGIIDHIDKELDEVEASDGAPSEWIDVVLLALDGLWRAMAAKSPELTDHEIAAMVCFMLVHKQGKNEARQWPDWRTLAENEAIEHIKSCEAEPCQ